MGGGLSGWRRCLRSVAAAVLLAGLGGCGISAFDLPIVGATDHAGEQTGDFSGTAAKQLFAEGLSTIDQRYIEPVQLSTLTLHGLQGLKAIEPDLRVDRDGDMLRLTIASKPVTTLRAPSDHDSDGWAAVVAQTLSSGRAASEKLHNASNESLYQAVFDGSIHDLDRFSRYVGNDAARDSRAAREGFGGIGILLEVRDDIVRITSVVAETPAAQAGLLKGDEITQVNGAPVGGLPERAIISMLRGPVDTDVSLTIGRDGVAPFPVKLRRTIIVPPTVTYQREAGNLAYFKIMGFNRQTAATLRLQVERAKREIGRDLRGVVLDLRNNPGGLLDQGVEVARLFLPKGRILTTRGRHPDSLQEFDADERDILNGLPIAVLVNGGSASAAEIVAAALQDLGRAVLIGSGSYGKGTVQTVTTLPNGGELTITWARFFAPSGYALQGLGVLPNICTSAPAATAAKSIDDLRGGRLDPFAPVSARRTADSLSAAGQLALAATCQKETAAAKGDDIDLQVAGAVLADPALILRVTRGAAVAAAPSP